MKADKTRHRFGCTAALACVIGACSANVRPPAYAHFRNGGVPLAPGSCAEVSVAIRPEAVPIWRVQERCEEAREWSLPTGATAVFWRVASGAGFVGPAIPEAIDVALLPLVLHGSGSATTVAGGGSTGVVAQGGSAGMQSGSGTSQVAAGGGTANLLGGSGSAGLTGGSGSAALQSGSGSAPLIAVAKHASVGEVLEGSSSEFSVDVRNVGTVAATEVVVVDRVSPLVEVEAAQDATVVPFADRSTVLVWRLRRGLAPGARESFFVRYSVRGQEISP